MLTKLLDLLDIEVQGLMRAFQAGHPLLTDPNDQGLSVFLLIARQVVITGGALPVTIVLIEPQLRITTAA